VQNVTAQGKCLRVSPGPQIRGIPRPTSIHPVVSVDRVKPFYYSDSSKGSDNRTDDDPEEEQSAQVREIPLEYTTSGQTTSDRPRIEFIPLDTDNVRAGSRMGEVIFTEASERMTDTPDVATPADQTAATPEPPEPNPRSHSLTAGNEIPENPPEDQPSSNEGEEVGQDETQSTATEPMEESRNESITTESVVEPESPEVVQEEAEGFKTAEENEPEPE
jgi:hypothetical protein